MTLGQWLPVVSPLLSALALATTWVGWRRAELRRGDVLVWGMQGIEVLQTLVLLCRDAPGHGDDRAGFATCRTKASILVEQGRLFFRNGPPLSHGAGKPPAYRGLRSCILDPLVTGCRLASAAPGASDDDRARMALVAQDGLHAFVSLLQKEVGRSRTAAADTSAGGVDAPLSVLMARADPEARR